MNEQERNLNGFLPSPPDDRDYTLDKICAVSLEEPVFPEEYLLEGNIPVLDQGVNSDCVAHAIATATAYGQYKAEGKFNDLSRGYIYGNRRDTDYQGEGMYVRQALKNFNHDGDCLNPKFPYRGIYPYVKAKIQEHKEEYAEAASKSKLINYCRLYSETEVKKALMNQGAVVLGITTYKGHMNTHITPPTKDSVTSGGHAMCCIGWNKEGWILQNSWGKYNGDKGKYYLPYEYPVDEWWGLTASTSIPDPEKDCLWKRFWGYIKSVWNSIKNYWRRKK